MVTKELKRASTGASQAAEIASEVNERTPGPKTVRMAFGVTMLKKNLVRHRRLHVLSIFPYIAGV